MVRCIEQLLRERIELCGLEEQQRSYFGRQRATR